MIGRKTTTAPSMISSVSLLDDASQTVRLAFGSLDDGRRKGKRAKPALAMVAAHANAEPRKASSGRLRNVTALNAAAIATTGASHSAGCRPAFESQPPGLRMTVFSIGFDAA